MQPVGVQDYFSQNVLKFGFGDGKNVYMKKGAIPFLQISRKLDLWMGNFCAAKKMYRAVIILAVKKVGHLNIKTKMFDFEARVLIGWLVNILTSQPIRTRTSKSNIFVFM